MKTEPAPLSRFKRWVKTQGLKLDRGSVQIHAGAVMSNAKQLEGDLHVALNGVQGTLKDAQLGGSAVIAQCAVRQHREKQGAVVVIGALIIAAVGPELAGAVDVLHLDHFACEIV